MSIILISDTIIQMKAIILVAGRGARMAPLTDNLPKPMLTVHGKNLIEWKLEALPEKVDGIIFVVGYKKEIITNYFGRSWRNIPITYIEQTELNGTGGAVKLCEPYIDDKALILMGDDIYNKEDLERLSAYDYALLAYDEGEAGLAKKAQVITRDGLLIGINEGYSQTGAVSMIINTGACVISKKFFSYPLVKVSETEYGLSNTLAFIAKDTPIHVLEASRWLQITSPECLKKAEEVLA